METRPLQAMAHLISSLSQLSLVGGIHVRRVTNTTNEVLMRDLTVLRLPLEGHCQRTQPEC